MFTISPRASRRRGRAAAVTRIVPRRFTSSWRSMRFVSSSSTRPAIPTPAEFTSRSSRPCVSRCSSTRRRQSSSRATSAVTACAFSDAAAASTLARVRAARVRAKPSSRSIVAMASPIPEEPPVTRAARSMSHPRKSGRSLAPGAELRRGGTERLLLSPDRTGEPSGFPRAAPFRLRGIEAARRS